MKRLPQAMWHRLGAARRALFRRGGGYRWIGSTGLMLQRIGGGTTTLYQPRVGVDNQRAEPLRPTAARWKAISPHLPTTGSALDIGCSNGFFTFKLADHGLFSLGVDHSIDTIATAQLLAVRNDATRVAFGRLQVTPQTVVALPAVDVVLCLSVFHNLVRLQGLDSAKAIMRVLSSKTKRLMVFETGHANEDSTTWSQEMASIGDPEKWVDDLLHEIGFMHVHQVGAFQARHDSTHKRTLFVAEK